jgi:hypothetical protein
VYGVRAGETASPNLRIWNAESGAVVKEVVQRKADGWCPQWSKNETLCCLRDANNEALFYSSQCCQMICFQIKHPNLGKFWRVLQCKILVYFMTIRSILLILEMFYGHLVCFVVIWYIFPSFGILCQEKSGNPDSSD